MAKVLIFAPGIDRGGVATALRSILRLLQSEGHSVAVLTEYAEDVDAAAIPKRFICGSLMSARPKCRLVTRFKNLFHLLTGYRFYFLGVPWIAHDLLILFQAPGQFHWVHYTTKPIIGWVHGILHSRNDAKRWSFQERLRLRIAHSFYSRFSAIIAVSQEAAESFARHYGICASHIIYNLINIEDVLSLARAFEVHKAEGKKNLVYVGRMTRDKGLDRLITVLGDLKREGFGDWVLKIVGDGPERSRIEKLIDGRGISEEINCVGLIENPYPYMTAADLLICPSRQEGLGLVLWEALLCETSVMSTKCGGPVSVLRGGEWGCLVENDDDSLKNGIRSYLEGNDCAPVCGFGKIKEELRLENVKSEKELKRLWENLW